MLETIVIRFGTWRHRVRWACDSYPTWYLTHYYRIYWKGLWTPFCRKEIQ